MCFYKQCAMCLYKQCVSINMVAISCHRMPHIVYLMAFTIGQKRTLTVATPIMMNVHGRTNPCKIPLLMHLSRTY